MTMLIEPDFGTPASKKSENVTVEIDGKSVTVPAETSIMRAAAMLGNNINYAPSVNKWVKLSAGSFSNFLITFCDQNLNTLAALDNNILITVLFRFPSPRLLRE